MPSVVATWEGQCKDHKVQKELCDEIIKLAHCSHKLFTEYFNQKIDPVFHDEDKVYQKVLLCRDVFYRQPVPAGLRKLEEESYFREQITSYKADGNISRSGYLEEIYITEKVSFFGVDFLLFDPRAHNYPFGLSNSQEMSFVFMRCENPELDGRLVKVRDLNPENPLASYAEKIIHIPTLDLRYYLESWTRKFLGWVKHFYIPDLYYWIWIDYGGDYAYQEYLPEDRKAAKLAFKYLLKSFTKEARDFTAECNAAREKRDVR